jgi:nitric oxide reductase subunit C
MVNRNPLVYLSTLFTLCTFLAACASESAGTPTLTQQENQGSQLFTVYCAACHSTVGDAIIVGPSLARIATTAETRVAGLDARAYLEQSILDPSAYLNEGFADLMPKNWGDVLNDEELDALVAFLLTLH